MSVEIFRRGPEGTRFGLDSKRHKRKTFDLVREIEKDTRERANMKNRVTEDNENEHETRKENTERSRNREEKGHIPGD